MLGIISVRSHSVKASAALVTVLLTGCANRDSELLTDGGAPFVTPNENVLLEAPFRGPVEPLADQQLATPHRPELLDAGTDVNPTATPSWPPPPIEIAAPADPNATIASSVAHHRREVWLTRDFRCKAISTTRLRRCRFEQTATGYRLRFPISDVTCENVVFDEHGNPERLTGCRGAWLKIPTRNRLRPDRALRVWSGSHRGWRWKHDSTPYCCPGLWLQAPDAISS